MIGRVLTLIIILLLLVGLNRFLGYTYVIPFMLWIVNIGVYGIKLSVGQPPLTMLEDYAQTWSENKHFNITSR